MLGEHLGDVAQQPRPVERLDLDRHHERGRLVVVPLDLDDALGVIDEAGGVGAVGAVHRDAAAAGDEAHDLVAGHRRAAPRQPHHHVVEALDVHARGAAARRAGRRGGRCVVTGSCSSPPRSSRCSRCTTALRRHVALADGGVEHVEVGVVDAPRRRACSASDCARLLHRQALACAAPW